MNSRIHLLDIMLGLSEALDLVSHNVANHHMQVAYIALSIADKLGLPEKNKMQLVMAGACHDLGALSVEERLTMLSFEDHLSREHAEIGYLLLKQFEPLEEVAKIVKYHHVPWNYGQGKQMQDEEVPMESHIIHLADRIAVLINDPLGILAARNSICERIKNHSGIVFMPDYVEVFLQLAEYEYFWLDIVSHTIQAILSQRFSSTAFEISMEELISLARLFSRIVDFRSPLNAAHSSGVAVSAQLLAGKAGLTVDECKMMKVAGYFHDLGKLAVPPKILEKPGRLTNEEFMLIKRHPYYTHSILSKIRSLESINKWASLHHERLDGTGYPFHLKEDELPLGSQIMAVADIYTAICEDRPYRKGMQKDDAFKVLTSMVNNKAINGDLVQILTRNFAEIDGARRSAQAESSEEYKRFLKPLIKMNRT